MVPNSVPDPGPPTPPGQGLVFVGRLDHQKGIGLLLRAWERSGLDQEAVLTIVGDGPERDAVERAAARLQGIRYFGPASPEQVVQHMRASRAVIVSPIGFEALPTVVLEAYACGRPIVATKVGPLSSLVPSDAGWLASADPESLAGALRQSCRDPKAATMATRARELYLARYSPDAVLDTLVSAYRSVISLPKDASPLGSSLG